jgi:hypothetical protein
MLRKTPIGERLWYGMSAGALFGLLGLVGGFWLGRSTQPQRGEVSSIPASITGASKPEGSPVAGELPAPRSLEPPPAPAPLQPAETRGTTQTSRIPPRTIAGASGAAPPAKVAPRERFTLAEGLELLGQAERALHSEDAALALAVLGDFDRRAPRAMLRQERLATLVLASCGTRDTGAAREARDRLQQEFPNSIYARRLERACVGGALDASDAPSSDVPANLEDSGH